MFGLLAMASCHLLVGDPIEYAASVGGAEMDASVGSEDKEVNGGGGPLLDAADEASCEQADGFAGVRSCFRCAPATREQLLNACSDAVCMPFANESRLSGISASNLPPLPQATDVADAAAAASNTYVDAAPPDGGAPSGNPSCSSLPAPVYATGSSAATPFLASIALVLAAQSPPTTIVYKSQGSCLGVDAILNGAPMKGVDSATYWDAKEAEPQKQAKKCDLAEAGVQADIGFSDVFPSTCANLPQGLPSNILDSFGPVQTMVMTVPIASTQMAISAQAAYMVFGFGAASRVAPWTDESYIFQRNASSGTQGMIARSIGVAASQWKGKKNQSSDDVKNALLQAGSDNATAERAIGILACDYADPLRAQIRVLGFQDYGQSCAFWPDSTRTAFDKRNVRDGHYPIWGPLHMLTLQTTEGRPVKPLAQNVVAYMVGTTPLPNGVELLQLYAQRGLIPGCAMRVARTADGGQLVPRVPDQPCGCYFDELAAGRSSCQSCAHASECPSEHPSCSYGYCE